MGEGWGTEQGGRSQWFSRTGWEVEHSWTEEAGGLSMVALKNGQNFWAELARLFDFPVHRGKAEGLK
jgi:hypothetical protein